MGGEFGAFVMVAVVVSLPDGPVSVFVTMTGGGCNGDGSPIMPDELGMPDGGTLEPEVILPIVGGNGKGGTGPEGVTMAVEPGIVVGSNGVLGADEATGDDLKL
jgi:hypothetical protein